MSIQAISYVLDHSRSEHSARLVLLAIANHTNDEGLASAAVATYGRETRLGERTVQTALRQLEADGEIEPAGAHPKYRTTLYRMLFPCLQATLEEGAESAPVRNLQGAETERDSAPEPKASGVTGSRTAETSVVPNSAPTARASDPIFETLFALDAGRIYTPEARGVLTRKAAASLNAAAAEIRATGVSADELAAAISAWPELFPGATATAQAVAKHLPRLLAARRGILARRQVSDADDRQAALERLRRASA